MSTWPVVALGSKVRFLSGGTPRKDEAKYWNGEIPWVGSAEMVQRRIRDTALRVTEEGAREGSKLVPAKTVLVVVRGMSLAKEFRVAITERELAFNQDLKALRPTADLDPMFLFYYLLSQNSAIRDSASEAAHGTKKLDMPVLEQWPVPLPPIDVQCSVASILSAYDDLIANNQRRITLLESMAEEIYREWFVRMRFPGHESVPKAKGLPQGWHLKPFAQVVDINPAERLAKEDEHPFVPMDELSIHSMFFSTSIRRKGSAGSRFRNGDVLFPRITPSLENGKRGFVMCFEDNEVAVGSTEFIVMREHEISAEHIYFLTCSEGFRKHAEISMVGASGRQRVSEGCFSFFLVPVPPDAQRRAFTGLVRPMFKEVGSLSKQNALLAATRDALLPRLISGKLKVDHLDIQFPPSMREKVTA